MLFLNTALLVGAIGIIIPIVIHLLNRRSNRIVNWGAMDFLLESLAIRNRRIQLEEALLMATRCLVVGLLALALARPFVPPGSSVPWIVVLPAILLSIIGLGVSVVMHNEPRWRIGSGIVSGILLILCVLLILFEKQLNLSRFNPAARQDIALVIDASTSMMMKSEGLTNFQRAVDEAREIVKRAPRGHAFSLILGGPSPSGKILDPTTDRAELDSVLAGLQPLDGPMATYHALTLASLSLARGIHPAKQIILLTDEQDVGWEKGKAGRWNFLRDAFRNLPSEPQIMIRKMPLPDQIRNVAVTNLELSREIVGVDRPVEIAVTIENTGDEAVTPGSISLRIDEGSEQVFKSMGQILPASSQTVRFTHQFSESGAHAITATLEVTDDIDEDNSSHTAINVASSLKVLLVDGQSSNDFLERAATFPAIALAPSRLTLNPQLTPNLAPDSDADDDYFAYDPTIEPIRFLVEPKVISTSEVSGVSDYGNFDVVMLVDVPRLTGETARQLGEFVKSGGGLLVAAGTNVIPGFYNNWMVEGDTPLLPGRLAEEVTVAPTGEEFTPSSQTLTHPAMAKIADPAKSDIGQALFSYYRNQSIPDSLKDRSSVGARLNNGDILLSSSRVDRGNVVLLGTSLDTASGNFVTRQSFLPFIHELTYQLANPTAYHLNLEPGWEVNMALTARRGGAIGEGLIGEYFNNPSAEEPDLTRPDNAVQFDWGNGSPAEGIKQDGFKIRWSGRIQVPKSGEFRLMADVAGSIEVFINNSRRPQLKAPGRLPPPIRLEANRWYPFEAIYRAKGGPAKAILYWQSAEFGKQIIPSRAFRSFASPLGDPLHGRQSNIAQYSVNGPGDIARTASLSASSGGTILKLEGDIASGLYRMMVPPEETRFFSEFLKPETTSIPFTVKRDSSESYLTRLTPPDYEFFGDFVTLSHPDTLDQLIGFLSGNQFGLELWKWLAVAALFFLLVEILLSRWIARSRRMGEEIDIGFDSTVGPSEAFQQQLVKMGKATVK